MSTDEPPRRRRRPAAPRAAPPPPSSPRPATSGSPRVERPAPVSEPVRTRRALPLVPITAAALGLVLLGAAWTTRWPPGPPSEAEQSTRFTLEIPADRQRVINSWESFFVCYDLRDPAVVDLTLRANQRATGSLDFPREKVIVELPAAGGAAPRPEATEAEEELVQLRSAIANAQPERLSTLQRQCAG